MRLNARSFAVDMSEPFTFDYALWNFTLEWLPYSTLYAPHLN